MAPDGEVASVVELRGRLFAWGNTEGPTPGFPQPAIWTSADGSAWSDTSFPPASRERSRIINMIDVGDHLVALATGGVEYLGDIDIRPTATMIYTSLDGRSWQEVENTPGVDAGAHPVLLDVGDRLLAVGRDIWVSSDGGLSWTVSTTSDDLGARMTSAAQKDGLIVGIGNDYRGRGIGTAGLIWTSSDDGATWTRQVRSTHRYPYSVVFGAAGQVVVLGTGESPLVVWVSNDRGETWATIMPDTAAHSFTGEATALPGGYAAAGDSLRDARGELESIVWTSPDAITWTERYLDILATQITWTPTFGLVAAGWRYDGSTTYGAYVALGPDPFH
jgi:hypothetical protein